MTLLKPGQAVRCARCAREWVPSPVEPEAPVATEPESTGTAVPDPDISPEVTRPRRPAPTAQPVVSHPNVVLRLAWAASIVAILLLGWGGYAQRATIMQIWPPSVRLYTALGLAAGH